MTILHLPGWMSGTPLVFCAAFFALTFVLAVIIGCSTAWSSLTAPYLNSIAHIKSFLEGAESADQKQLAQHEIGITQDEMNESLQAPGFMRARRISHVIVLSALYFSSLYVCNSFLAAASLSLILTLLFLLATTDLDHCMIPQSSLFALAIICGWVTILPTSARWTTPVMAMVGMVAVASVCVASMSIARVIASRRGTSRSMIIFGDGDVLLLIALSLFLGPDVLALLMVACAMMLPGYLFRNQFATIIKKTGHNLSNFGAGLPFVPAIFLAFVVITFAQRPHWLEFNKMAQYLLKNYLLNGCVLSTFN